MDRILLNTVLALSAVMALSVVVVGQTRSPRAVRAAREAQQRIPALLKQLDDADPKTWQSAMTELAKLKESAVPQLVQRVRKAGLGSLGRARAVQVLGRIGARAVVAVPVMLDILPGASSRTQSAITLALARVGPYAGAERSASARPCSNICENKATGVCAICMVSGLNL